jgi:hypothetical protein
MKQYTPSYHTLNMPMNKKILKTTDNLIDDFFDRHSKLFGMRQDVHLPEGSDQSLIMKVNHRFIESQKNKGYGPAYVMVREVSPDGKTHYHMALFLDGQKVKSTYYVFKDMERILNNVAGPGGSINHCDDKGKNGIMIKRDDPDPRNLQEVQRQFSYLAKIEQKDKVKSKTFFRSQIKKK